MKNTILSYNKAENSKRIKRNEEKVCASVFGCWMVFDSLYQQKTVIFVVDHTRNMPAKFHSNGLLFLITSTNKLKLIIFRV